MTNTDFITMLVCWKEQTRLIDIHLNDDINTVKTAIINTFELQQSDCFYEYQIQYYDNIYQKFIDLYSETLDQFRQLICKLLSSDAPPKSTQDWIIKVVSQSITTMRRSTSEALTDDTYNYQQENDPTIFLQSEEKSFSSNNQINSIQSSLSSNKTNNNNPENLPKVPIFEDNHEHQQKLNRYNAQSIDLNITTSELVITLDHPFCLNFDCNLADNQRKQFECEMIRKTSEKQTIGGVLLRAAHKSNGTSSEDVPYPSIHFQIPTDKIQCIWYLYVYILTEADSNGVHYLHASKGIYDNYTKPEDKFGIIPNTQLVNPYVIKLSQDDIRDGRYELKIKVCNIRNLSTRKHEQLREFPRLNNNPIIYDDQTLLSANTTSVLKFSNEKYHVGCILVFNKIAHDRCISNLTMAGKPKAPSVRKRTNTDASTTQDDDDDRETNKKRQRNGK